MGRAPRPLRHLFAVARLRHFRAITVLRADCGGGLRDALAASRRAPPLPRMGLSDRARTLHRRRNRPDGRSAHREARLHLARPPDRDERRPRLLVPPAPPQTHLDRFLLTDGLTPVFS